MLTTSPANTRSTLLRTGVLLVVLAGVASPGVLLSSRALADEKPLEDRCWDNTFTEDFNELDLYDEQTGKGRWRTRYIWERETAINEELQYYVDPATQDYTPFSIDDGILGITAEPVPAQLVNEVAGQQYVSGVLTTERDFNQKYGRFEMLAKAPAGQGLWTAFWLLPSFDQWPKGVAILPEIDVMELIGNEPDTLHTTLHTNQTGKLTSHPYHHRMRERLTDDFHLYSAVWTEDTVTWFLDRQPMAQHPTPKDFNQPVHFLIHLAVGGTWPGPPDATTPFPAVLEVDYIKAWKDNGECSNN